MCPILFLSVKIFRGKILDEQDTQPAQLLTQSKNYLLDSQSSDATLGQEQL